MAAKKEKKGKPFMSLFMETKAYSAINAVMTFGAFKYGRDNWKGGGALADIRDSEARHAAKMARGEIFDSESGLPHAAHRMFWLMAELEIDDRVPDYLNYFPENVKPYTGGE